MHFLDWPSSTIKRVVRSTLAAESASASKAFDRAVYCRALLSECMLGPKARSMRWTDMVQSVPMLFLSDCRSMVEHIKKTGASTDEKRVAMDLADLRHGIDNGDIISWMPTRKMVADCLTKHLTFDEEIEAICELLRSGKMHFRYADDGTPRTLTAEQLRQEGVVNASHLESSLAVPREYDSEDEASYGMLTGSKRAAPSSDALWSQSGSAIVADGAPMSISETPGPGSFENISVSNFVRKKSTESRTGGPPPRAGAQRIAHRRLTMRRYADRCTARCGCMQADTHRRAEST